MSITKKLLSATRHTYRKLMGENSTLSDLPVALLSFLCRGRWTIRSRDGFRFTIDLNDTRGAMEALRHGRIEPELAYFYHRILRSEDCVVDVGANIGYFAVLPGHLVGASGRVLALEPTPSTAAFCRHNILLNRLQNTVSLLELAASDSSGDANFYINPKYSGNNSLVDLDNLGNSKFRKPISVPTLTIDELLADWNRLDLVKIDVEGHELRVIRGMRETLVRFLRLVVVCEIAPRWLRSAGTTPDEIFETFMAHKMHGYPIGRNGQLLRMSFHEHIALLESEDRPGNFVFARSGVIEELVKQGRVAFDTV